MRQFILRCYFPRPLVAVVLLLGLYAGDREAERMLGVFRQGSGEDPAVTTRAPYFAAAMIAIRLARICAIPPISATTFG
jgi:hypothetical protein